MAFGDVLRTIPTPLTGPGDVAFDGRSLYVYGDTVRSIAQIDLRTGQILRTVAIENGGRLFGFTFTGGSYFVGMDSLNGILAVYDVRTLQVQKSVAIAMISRGASFDGKSRIWLANDTADVYMQFDLASLGLVRSLTALGANVAGIACNGPFLFVADDTANTINQIDTRTGELIRSAALPDTTPRGLEWDGRSLWLVGSSTSTIYQIAVQ